MEKVDIDRTTIDQIIQKAINHAADNEVTIKHIHLEWEHFATNSHGSVIKPKLKIEFFKE